MPSDADYAAMAYGRGNLSEYVTRLLDETIAAEQAESRKNAENKPDAQEDTNQRR